jgi:hypothetical protein
MDNFIRSYKGLTIAQPAEVRDDEGSPGYWVEGGASIVGVAISPSAIKAQVF